MVDKFTFTTELTNLLVYKNEVKKIVDLKKQLEKMGKMGKIEKMGKMGMKYRSDSVLIIGVDRAEETTTVADYSSIQFQITRLKTVVTALEEANISLYATGSTSINIKSKKSRKEKTMEGLQLIKET